MLALFAELEVETIRNRIREVFESKRARHELCGKPAYGQRVVPSGQFNKRGKEIMLAEPDLQETVWLIQMIAWRQAGLSYAAIARELNARGVPPKTPAGTLVGCRTGGNLPAGGLYGPKAAWPMRSRPSTRCLWQTENNHEHHRRQQAV